MIFNSWMGDTNGTLGKGNPIIILTQVNKQKELSPSEIERPLGGCTSLLKESSTTRVNKKI